MKPISRTAFYCCGVRMLDAERERPVCGDVYANVFMNEDGFKILETFKDETGPNSSNVARHRIIDDLLRQELAAHPDLRAVIIGAGFDTRLPSQRGFLDRTGRTASDRIQERAPACRRCAESTPARRDRFLD